VTPAYHFQAGDAAALRGWAASVRAVVQRLAFVAPPDVSAEPPASVTEEGLRREHYFFALAGGGGFDVIVVRPETTQVLPALLSSGALRDEVELARSGVIVVSLGARTQDAALLALTGQSPLTVELGNLFAVQTWLAETFGVHRFGYHGAGDFGAAVALHAALIAGGSGPVALDTPVATYESLLAGSAEAVALNGILRYADLPDLVAALVPRPLWLPTAAETVSAAYALAEAPVTVGGSLVEFFAGVFGSAEPTPGIPPLRVYFDLNARREVADNLDQVLSSGMLTQGQLVPRFEALANRFTGSDDTVAVATGTAALDIAYQLLDVSGKTVLVPVNTFFATAASVDRMGGNVEFVDVELDGFGMDPKALREALQRHDDVAAVVVVHIGGIVAPSFREVLAECAARGIPVVEDTAHALGATLDGQLAGSFGAMGTYSLHPAKVATSGEGGLFTAKDPAHVEAARKLRDHGKISISQNIHDRLGNNWRLSEVHAAVGLAHFAQLDEMLAMRRSLAAWYDQHIDSVPRIKRYNVPQGAESNYYKYLAFLDPSIDRADLKARLRRNHGVSLAGEVYDVLLSDQPYYATRFAGRTFENALWFTKHHICLPAFPSMTTKEQEHVLNALRSELS
jgi:perosamine synthetase